MSQLAITSQTAILCFIKMLFFSSVARTDVIHNIRKHLPKPVLRMTVEKFASRDFTDGKLPSISIFEFLSYMGSIV